METPSGSYVQAVATGILLIIISYHIISVSSKWVTWHHFKFYNKDNDLFINIRRLTADFCIKNDILGGL